MANDMKVLIVASKCPIDSSDCDGGGMLVRDFAAMLPALFRQVDFLFLRKEIPEWNNWYRGGKSYFFPPDEMKTTPCKFTCRVNQSHDISAILASISLEYNLILVIHVSNLFRVNENLPEIMKKTILFPMFTSASYILSDQRPPDEYRNLEREALLSVSRIISPSRVEARSILGTFPSLADKVAVIPRVIDQKSLLRRVGRDDEPVKLLNLASIKPQKNQLFLLRSVRACLDRNLNVECHIVGGIQDRRYHTEVLATIDRLNLRSHVYLHGACTPDEVGSIATGCDVNVIVSTWETFCRGFFEGAALGLPSMACRDLSCIWEYAPSIPLLGSFERSSDDFFRCLSHLIVSIRIGDGLPESDKLFPTMSKESVTEQYREQLFSQLDMTVSNGFGGTV